MHATYMYCARVLCVFDMFRKHRLYFIEIAVVDVTCEDSEIAVLALG